MDIADAADIKSGFAITFRFSEGNRLFANQELRKDYFFTEDGCLTINGTHVEWSQARAEFARRCKGSELGVLRSLCTQQLCCTTPGHCSGVARGAGGRSADEIVLKKQEPQELA